MLHLFYQMLYKSFFCILILLSLVYLQFIFCNLASSPSLVLLLSSSPVELSFVPYFYSLPLCNCIITLLPCDCKCFCIIYQILSNLLHSISYFAQSFCCFLSIALHFYYFQSHTVLHLSPVYPSSHNLVLFALLLPPAMSSAS